MSFAADFATAPMCGQLDSYRTSGSSPGTIQQPTDPTASKETPTVICGRCGPELPVKAGDTVPPHRFISGPCRNRNPKPKAHNKRSRPAKKRRSIRLRHLSSTAGVAHPNLDTFSMAVINYLSTGKPEYFTSAKKIILGTLYRKRAWTELPGVDGIPSHEGNELFVADWLNNKIEPYVSFTPEQLKQAALRRAFCYWPHEAACDACNSAQKKRPVFLPYDDAVRTPERLPRGSDWEYYLSQNQEVLCRVLGKDAASDLEFLLINKGLLEKPEGELGRSKTVATLLQEKYPDLDLRTVERKVKTLNEVMAVHSDDALVREIHSELRRPLNGQKEGKPSRLPDLDDQVEAASN